MVSYYKLCRLLKVNAPEANVVSDQGANIRGQTEDDMRRVGPIVYLPQNLKLRRNNDIKLEETRFVA